MSRPNQTEKLDVSDTPGIVEALNIERANDEYDGGPQREPTRSFDLETGGALQLTLANGDVLVIHTSEWGNVDYYAVPGIETCP